MESKDGGFKAPIFIFASLLHSIFPLNFTPLFIAGGDRQIIFESDNF